MNNPKPLFVLIYGDLKLALIPFTLDALQLTNNLTRKSVQVT